MRCLLVVIGDHSDFVSLPPASPPGEYGRERISPELPQYSSNGGHELCVGGNGKSE
jgi:hypothetical protein